MIRIPAVLAVFALCAAPVFGEERDPFLDREDIVLPETNSASQSQSGAPVLNVFIDSLLRQPGFGLYADYSVMAAYYPGWNESPWSPQFNGGEFFNGNQPLGADINATVGLDIRLSPVLSFWQSVKFSLREMDIQFAEFYADYIFLDHVFIKIGKYDYEWGITRANFRYTNLLGQVPESYPETSDKDFYIAKALMPISFFNTNWGDIEVLGYTRHTFFSNGSDPQISDFAFGTKFNLRRRWADIDIGTLYFKMMPLRVFLSVKSTLFSRTEVYAESLVSIDNTGERSTRFSCSAGFYNDFFKRKLIVNSEFFWNGEENTHMLIPENPLEDKKKKLVIAPGSSLAANIEFRPGIFFNMRLGVKFRYAINDNSGQIIPGMLIEPARHLRIYFAVPLVVGSDSGKEYSYFSTNDDKLNRKLSLIFAVSLGGSWEFTRYRAD